MLVYWDAPVYWDMLVLWVCLDMLVCWNSLVYWDADTGVSGYASVLEHTGVLGR